VEEAAEQLGHVIWQRGLVERAIHQLHPAVARALIDGERRVAHAQPGMAALVDVVGGTAEAVHQEPAEPLLGASQILWRIHRAQDVVCGHLRVERVHQAHEAIHPDPREDLVFCQRAVQHSHSMSDEAPKSALELAMERLRRKDAEEGRDERLLSSEQKEEIAEIRRVYAARVAQAEILHKSSLLSMFDPEARQKLEADYRHEIERLNEEREKKIASVRERHD